MPVRLLICLLLLFIAPERALAFGDCTNAAYLAHFNVAGRVTGCEQRALNQLRFNGHTRDVRIFRINGAWHADDEQWIGDINAALDQIFFALEALMPRLNAHNNSIPII